MAARRVFSSLGCGMNVKEIEQLDARVLIISLSTKLVVGVFINNKLIYKEDIYTEKKYIDREKIYRYKYENVNFNM